MDNGEKVGAIYIPEQAIEFLHLRCLLCIYNIYIYILYMYIYISIYIYIYKYKEIKKYIETFTFRLDLRENLTLLL